MARESCSLIIATYNRGPRIARTLDSVLRQTVRPNEIVVVDDCSPDGTGDWVKANYRGVRLVRPDANRGTSGARNFGALMATEPILLFLDHDDELLPGAVATLLGLLHEFPKAGAAYADHAYTNTVSNIRFPDHHTQPYFARMRRIPMLAHTPAGRLYGRPMYRALLLGNLLQQPWAVRRELFLAQGGFCEDVRFCEDWDLYLRVTRAAPVVVSDHVISHHYVEGENLHLHPNQAAMHQRVIERHLRCARFRDPWAAWVLRRRLAGFLKAAGDRVRKVSLRQAWHLYLRSFANWPFDYVVGARCLLWCWQSWFYRGTTKVAKES